MTAPSRHLVRVARHGQTINPVAVGDLLYQDLLTHDPVCVEFVLEIDEAGIEELRSHTEYDVTLLAEDVGSG